MQELELQRVVFCADELAFQYPCADKLSIFKSTPERAAAVEAIYQNEGVMLCLTGRPSLHVKIIRHKDKFAITQMINIVDDLPAVNLPDQGDLLPL